MSDHPHEQKSRRCGRRAWSLLSALPLLLGVTGCNTSSTVSSSGDAEEWRPAAEAISAELIRDHISYQTIGPDPARRGAPRRVESSTSRVRGNVPAIEQRVATVAESHDVTTRCDEVSLQRALDLMAETDVVPDRGSPPSAVCNFTRGGTEFGFVVLAAVNPETTHLWYSVGPDAAHQAP